ncbi:hypothetical protein F5B21DRAFT_485833 [Xylaria acuta]|nr:hypothetical protein F5B21DRAFT_485833 [Xylaria acuta]
MALNLLLTYNLPEPTEGRRHVVIAPELTARVNNPSSENGSTIFNCHADNDDGDAVVIKNPSYQMRIFSQDADKSRTNIERKCQEIWKPSNVKDSVDPPIGIDHCGEPSTKKCNYNSDSEVEGDGHQTRVTLSGGPGATALRGSPAAAAGRGPPAVHDSLNLGKTAPLTPARILFSVREMLKNAFGTPASITTPAQISSAHSLLKLVLGNQGHAIALPPAVGCYHCATQRRADGTARAQIGVDGYIPRWLKGSTIDYIIHEESFKKPDLASFTAAKTVEATDMWEGIGVKFKQVPRNQPATFQVKYLDLPSDDRPDIYAESFFPQDERGTIFVYKLALEKEANRRYLANVLAHEIGHILGLRHNFAGDVVCKETGRTKEQGSVLWGERNESSIMNYFTDLRLYSIQEQDLNELKSFYDFTGEKYKGLTIRDFIPGRFSFTSVATGG